MRKAAESAAKWLADKVRGNPKLNPIPYPFFKSIVNKQVEWARTQRGIALDFGELSEAVRTELLKAGIHTMSEGGRQQSAIKTGAETASLFGEAGGTLTKKFAPSKMCSSQHQRGADASLCILAIAREKVKCPLLVKTLKEVNDER